MFGKGTFTTPICPDNADKLTFMNVNTHILQGMYLTAHFVLVHMTHMVRTDHNLFHLVFSFLST